MSFEEKTAAYLEFLRGKNIVLNPKVAVTDYRSAGQGRGLQATESIMAGETLFTVPPTSVLRIEFDKELAALVSKHNLDAWSALIVRMMVAQNTPEWKPYFEVLPSTFNTPMFWDDAESEKLLQGSVVLSKIGRESANELYDQLANTILKEPLAAALPAESTSREAFHRMGSLIMSFAFDVPPLTLNNVQNTQYAEDEQDEGKAMIPLADLLNSHTKLHNARLTIPKSATDNFEMVASAKIDKGDQIYLLYGNQPSGDMLRRYGFVEADGTDYEVVEITRELVKATARATISEQQINERDELFCDKIGDIEIFELGWSVDDEIEVEEDDSDGSLSPELEVEPELIIYVNCLVVPELKRKQFKEILALSEADKLLEPAKELLMAVVQKRREEYGVVPPLDPESAPATRVWLSKEDMCTQVRLSEMRVLEMAEDWIDAADTVEALSSKKQKTS